LTSIITCAILLGAGISAAAEQPTFRSTPDAARAGMDPARLERIPARMREFVDRGTAAGVVTLVVRHGQVAALSAVGYKDLAEKTPMRADTIFQVMSMTKALTATAIMVLVEEGRLSLIDPVEKFLPSFHGQLIGDRKPQRPIAIRDMMTHTSGMGSWAGKKGDYVLWSRTLSENIDECAHSSLLFEPGTNWKYSGCGFATLGRIVEVVSGQTFDGFLAERVLRPLGMVDTFFFPPDDKKSRIASFYAMREGKLVRDTDDEIYRRGAKDPAPEGGLYSTAIDMARFYQMLLNGGSLNGRRVLARASVEAMTMCQTGDLKVPLAPGMGYGFGLFVIRDPGGTFRLSSIGSYGHYGSSHTLGWVDPKRDMISVILFQRHSPDADIGDEFNAFLAMAAASLQE
jgi:CubicO group peptidase (beta-lactamase class C family)